MNATVQLNTRVRSEFSKDVQTIADFTRVPVRQIIEDALAFYSGKADEVVLARRNMAVKALAPVKVKRAA